MAFTYTIATERGQVRLAISDTSSSAYAFEDAEIDFFLSSGGSVEAAIVLALRTLLASRALRVKRASLPGLTYDDTAQVQALKDLLAMYGGDMPTLVVTMPAPLDMDTGFTDPSP